MLTVLTGRSRRLWPRVADEIGRAHARGGERLLLLTPDQYTLQAELELIARLDLPGLLGIEVLSPSRLLTRVFALAGSPQRVRIDGRGKAMLLADVARRARKELLYYGGAAGRPGFADRLGSAIADCKAAGMTPGRVAALGEALESGDSLGDKLRDVALLYAAYQARLEGAFVDGEDVQEALLARLPESGLLTGARVWIYGFDLLSMQFVRQIAVMARLARELRLALTLENETARDGRAFAPARETLARLARYLDGESLAWEREHVEAPLSAPPEIERLERELFAFPARPFEGEPKAVTLRVAADPHEEAMAAAAEMLALARAGMRFDGMAVVAGDMEAYAGAVEAAFGRSGVPYHLARRRPALSHPLPRAWLAALRCVTRGWRPEDALDWLKGGFCGLTREEAELLENYAIEHGLKGAKWRRPIPEASLEALRLRFVAPLHTLQGRLREAADAAGILAAAYGILEDCDAFAALEAWQAALWERGLAAEAAECAQAWRLLLEILDQLHALLGGERLPMASLAQVLEAGLLAAELGAVPVSPGVVQVGQLGHMKLGGSCRALFLLGMQDGVLRQEAASLLTDAEAARAASLTGKGEEGAFGLRGDALAQLTQINLLDTLAAPSERLFISYALAGPGGEAQRPAAVLRLLRKVFPTLPEQGGASRPYAAWHAPGAALDALGPALRAAAARAGGLSPEEAQAAAWLLASPDTRAQAERILTALERPSSVQPLSGPAAAALYARRPVSVTRLQDFALCPYRHFVGHGLRPRKRRAFEVAREETGMFFHRAMEGFVREAPEEPGWPDISRERCDALMNRVLAPLKREWADAPLGDNAMLAAEGEAFCRVARRAAWTYAGQQRDGSFRASVLEARFGLGEALAPLALSLSGGGTVLLEGRIDRIDFLEEGETRWLRVVDYKSGKAALDYSSLYGGLQLQLLLYLSAALAAFPGVKPAGAFYSAFDDPLIETDSRDAARVEQEIARRLSLKGIALSDVRVLRAMDGGDSRLKTDGTAKKRSDAVDDGDLAALMRHAANLAGELARSIARGETAPRPAQQDGRSACAWCDAREACGFDPALPGMRPRVLEKLSKEAVLERVRGR